MLHAFASAVQTENAFQKQDAVFVGRKRALTKKTCKGLRYAKSVGLGFKTPKEAITVSTFMRETAGPAP